MDCSPQIKLLLRHNVPRFIKHIKQRGGVTEEEKRWLTSEFDNPDCLIYVIERADEYLLFPENEDIFRKGFFTLVKGLAIASFMPDGVEFLGIRFCSEDESKT